MKCFLCSDEIGEDEPFVTVPTEKKFDHVDCYIHVLTDLLNDPISQRIIREVAKE